MSTSHSDFATTDPATTDIDVSSNNFVTTTLSDKMTLVEYTNAINCVFAIKNCFQRDFDRGYISKDKHMFLLSVAIGAIFKPSTA